ncbi:MAG: ADP-forming succinate--CoA ligase subunit beta [Gammaproteobacteria bacterium]|nr:ADP-forming succinate--CoA ligase subunit beta [Gammaproteobacteria bacterium]MCY4226908.1 ADP-forming succinate--CoA ligase subunit beta [Gammaproteobacteria bacterium]MCY4313955.1 ADP-forming succinate--CoA ligase subunit beta [Gammaproteobacteria bacterium]
MNIHEHQAKSLLGRFGVNVPRGYDVYKVDDVVEAAKKLEGTVWVVKAQIHAGGRGKGGGVRVVDSLDKLKSAADDILGMQLVTHQTGPDGQQVKRLYIEEGCEIARELYLGVLVDRASNRVSVIASTEGGMDIEEVAAKTPEKIISIPIDPATGLQPHHARRIAFALNLEGDQLRQAVKFLTGIYAAFTELDASLIEINPLAVTGEGVLLALDAKMNFDSNALFRHPEIEELRDQDEEDPAEAEAVEHDLSYIKLDGNIGCMVNGAGLAMATMDIIKLYGGYPANFLDVGGGASAERVTIAFKIILSDPGVKVVLVNIFGGILRCDVIAKGILEAAQQVQIHVPVVVRMEGTNVEKGKTVLAESGLPFILADGMADAAEKAVSALHQEV